MGDQVGGRELAVDAADERVHLVAQLAVGARRSRARAPPPARAAPCSRSSGWRAQQRLEREQPARDPLRVVEPVDADEELRARRARWLATSSRHLRRLAPARRELRRVDAHREHAEPDLAPAPARSGPPRSPRRASRSTAEAKWRTYAAVWKPTRSAPSSPSSSRSRCGQDPEDLRGGERDVEEEADPRVGDRARAAAAGTSMSW